ncbi:exuperantia, partial [Danaus plexippus plexippus]
YKLLDRFKSIVAGFTDSYALAADKCKSTVKSVSLRMLARVLLDADSLSVDSALDRATAAYRIVEHLAQGEQQEVGAGGEGTSKDMVETARQWARPVHTELEALANLKKLLERQNTFRPVFAPLLRLANPERKRVTQLRRLLADGGFLYDTLKEAWQEQQVAGLEKQLSSLTVSANESDIKELIEIFDCHFDPAKEPKAPRPRATNKVRSSSSAGEAEGSSSESQKTSVHNSPNKTNNDDIRSSVRLAAIITIFNLFRESSPKAEHPVYMILYMICFRSPGRAESALGGGELMTQAFITRRWVTPADVTSHLYTWM